MRLPDAFGTAAVLPRFGCDDGTFRGPCRLAVIDWSMSDGNTKLRRPGAVIGLTPIRRDRHEPRGHTYRIKAVIALEDERCAGVRRSRRRVAGR